MHTKRIFSQETFPAAALRLFRDKVRRQAAFVARWCWWLECDVVVRITPDATHLLSFYEFSLASLLLLLFLSENLAVNITIGLVILACTISTAALTMEALEPRCDGLLSSFWKCSITPVLAFFILWMVIYVAWRLLFMLVQFCYSFPCFSSLA